MLNCFLIVGFGSIGRRHVRLLRGLIPEAVIVVLRRSNCEDLVIHGVDHCVITIEEALQLNPQAAVIANPANYHVEVALSLAKAGVHLLIEKPISNTEKGVLELIEICRYQKLILMVGYNLRFLPSLQKFRQLINDECMGRVLSVRAEVGQYLPSWRPDSDYRNTVTAKAALGGGVLLELSHDIDYLRWIFGEVDWVISSLSKQSDLDIDVEDTAHLILGFSSDSEKGSLRAVLSMDCIRHDAMRGCTVIGEKGSLRWNAVAGTIEFFEQGSSHGWDLLFEHIDQRDDSYLAEWHHFLNLFDEKESPSASGDDGLAVLRIIEAARQSSESGMKITKNNSSDVT